MHEYLVCWAPFPFWSALLSLLHVDSDTELPGDAKTHLSLVSWPCSGGCSMPRSSLYMGDLMGDLDLLHRLSEFLPEVLGVVEVPAAAAAALPAPPELPTLRPGELSLRDEEAEWWEARLRAGLSAVLLLLLPGRPLVEVVRGGKRPPVPYR